MRGNIRGKKLEQKTKKLKKEPLYKCTTCGATGHIDKKTKQRLIYFPPPELPKKLKKFGPPITISFPLHDCELSKLVHQIDVDKLEKVRGKKS